MPTVMGTGVAAIVEAIGESAILLLTYDFFIMAFSIATYVLLALGMYTIAKRREIKHPWMAWVPVTNLWIMGSISDQYQYVTKGLIRNRRKVLIGLYIAMLAVALIAVIAAVISMVNLIVEIPHLEYMPEEQVITMVLTRMLVVFGVYGVMFVIAAVMQVFEYICLYNLYASCDPEHKTLFLVLSILVPVTLPIFVFACRNKDGGMPPRRDAAQPQLETNAE